MGWFVLFCLGAVLFVFEVALLFLSVLVVAVIEIVKRVTEISRRFR